MATSAALSTAANPTQQLCRSRATLGKPAKGLGPGMGRERAQSITCQAASSIPADRVPDMEKRKLMNLLLLGAISLPTVGMVVPYGAFFVPAGSGGAGGGTYAKDKLGNDITVDEWLKTHGPNDRTLAQGLKGDPTYLVVEQDKTLATYGINAVCTHLGCVVPWNSDENKFICPCHGSQYNNQGKVVRGPAPLGLQACGAAVSQGPRPAPELDALDATHRVAPPTPLKQPPDWANSGGMREKAFVMWVGDDDEDDTEDEDDGTSHGKSRALVAKGARFSCNDLESRGRDNCVRKATSVLTNYEA